MAHPWNKGLTKETSPSIMKASQTMKRRGIDNFAQWRKRMKSLGKIKSNYPALPKNKYLAELIGATLGDGHIQAFPRTERLVIVSNSDNTGFVKRYCRIIKTLFKKEPYTMRSKRERSIRISIYEKFISKRLGVPTGNKSNIDIGIPSWAWKNKNLMISCLRGFYETEGSFIIHLPTYTYKASFANQNLRLLKDVYRALQILGFSPLYEKNRIMVSKKAEFFRLKELLKFRQY